MEYMVVVDGTNVHAKGKKVTSVWHLEPSPMSAVSLHWAWRGGNLHRLPWFQPLSPDPFFPLLSFQCPFDHDFMGCMSHCEKKSLGWSRGGVVANPHWRNRKIDSNRAIRSKRGSNMLYAPLPIPRPSVETCCRQWAERAQTDRRKSIYFRFEYYAAAREHGWMIISKSKQRALLHGSEPWNQKRHFIMDLKGTRAQSIRVTLSNPNIDSPSSRRGGPARYRYERTWIMIGMNFDITLNHERFSGR